MDGRCGSGGSNSDMKMDPIVDFWGAELSAKQKRVQWPKPGDEMDPDVIVKLEPRHAALGAKAKEGERNVVEITTETETGREVTHTILSLRVGGTEQTPMFLELFPPVTFTLVAGSGPLHIVGTIYTDFDSDFTEDEEEEDEEDEEEEHAACTVVKMSSKRPATSPPSKPKKALKLGNGEEQVQEEEESEEKPDEKEEMDEEDSEEEASEEEEEEEENEEKEETEPKKGPKTPTKPILVSRAKSKSLQKPYIQKTTPVHFKTPQFKTPQPVKRKKTPKGTVATPSTAEQGKGGKKTPKTPAGVEEVKKSLKKTQNLPKKYDKFTSYVFHNFKVTDEKVKKELWEFVQKSRAEK